MITQQTMKKGTMQWCLMTTRDYSPSTEDLRVRLATDEHPNPPIYDYYLEDGRSGWAVGNDALRELAAFGQAMIVQQRRGTGTLERSKT